MILKKRIIDEVKMIIAGRKAFKALEVNQSLLNAVTKRYVELMIQAEKVIKRNMIRWYYRHMFSKKRVFRATLYLESNQTIRPN